jgi:HAD superfamily hydrolase (TIGR01549 family)
MLILSKNKTHFCKNIFLDLGGVLFYDEYVLLEFYHNSYSLIIRNKNITTDDFFLARQSLYPQYKSDWLRVYLKTLFDTNKMESIIAESWNCVLKNFSKLFLPYPHSLDFIFNLKKKYKLYIVANQPKVVNNILNNLKLINYFEKVYLDTIVGFSKPDLEFYKYVLNDSCTIPDETIHIGDRLDNDIIPALKLKILPIKLVFPIQKVSIGKLDKKFVESFYNSISKLWYRMVEDKSYNYAIAHSYEEILEALN